MVISGTDVIDTGRTSVFILTSFLCHQVDMLVGGGAAQGGSPWALIVDPSWWPLVNGVLNLWFGSRPGWVNGKGLHGGLSSGRVKVVLSVEGWMKVSWGPQASWVVLNSQRTRGNTSSLRSVSSSPTRWSSDHYTLFWACPGKNGRKKEKWKEKND